MLCTRSWKWVGGMLVAALLMTACGPSYEHQLTQARIHLTALEQSDAVRYLPETIAQLRQFYDQSESLLNSGEVAGFDERIAQLTIRIDKAFADYEKSRLSAQKKARSLLRSIVAEVDEVTLKAKNLPRLTYIDQNRYDRVRYRIKRIHDEIHHLNAALKAQDYLLVVRSEKTLKSKIRAVKKLLAIKTQPELVVTKKNAVEEPQAHAEESVKSSVAME